MFGSLQQCCLHQPAWTPVDAAEVLCSIQSSSDHEPWTDCTVPADGYSSWKDATESNSYTVARLKDGRYGLLAESEDYTGHGCQCDAAANVYDTLDDLLQFGVEEWQAVARDVIRARIGSAQ